MTQATAIAPATVANVGPGFDVLGFALAEPSVKITATRIDGTDGRVTLTADNSDIPLDPMLNTAGFAAMSLLSHNNAKVNIALHIHAGIPVGSGLGSSAASAVAGAMAVNAVLGSPYSTEELLTFALDGEAAASGARHADNVAPALFGGFVILRRHDTLDWMQIPVPPALHYAVVHPHCTVNTSEARKLLPITVPLSAATQQWANVATLVAALCVGDMVRIGRAMEDGIVEPVRATLIPGYSAVKKAAQDADAMGCTISGSGPSMLAFTDSAKRATQICSAMIHAFHDAGLKADGWAGPMDNPGARVV